MGRDYIVQRERPLITDEDQPVGVASHGLTRAQPFWP
jgi:hypothetical protein